MVGNHAARLVFVSRLLAKPRHAQSGRHPHGDRRGLCAELEVRVFWALIFAGPDGRRG